MRNENELSFNDIKKGLYSEILLCIYSNPNITPYQLSKLITIDNIPRVDLQINKLEESGFIKKKQIKNNYENNYNLIISNKNKLIDLFFDFLVKDFFKRIKLTNLDYSNLNLFILTNKKFILGLNEETKTMKNLKSRNKSNSPFILLNNDFDKKKLNFEKIKSNLFSLIFSLENKLKNNKYFFLLLDSYLNFDLNRNIMSSFNSLAKDLHSLDLIKILYLIENDRENYKNISEEEKNYFKKIIENNNDLFELNFLINLFSFFDISQFNNTLNIIGKEYFKNSKVKKGVLTQREIKIMRYRKYFEK